MTACTLVAGGSSAARHAAIAAHIDPHVSTAVILEGLHAAESPLANTPATPLLHVTTIAVGCPCCSDGLVMRVTLDRMLRRRPDALYVSLADATHVPHLAQFLSAPPYAALVSLCPVVICST
jgi:hypothetical protein